MKIKLTLLIILILAITPCMAQQDANDVISQMQSKLDLQQDQITNITPIINRYTKLFAGNRRTVSK